MPLAAEGAAGAAEAANGVNSDQTSKRRRPESIVAKFKPSAESKAMALSAARSPMRSTLVLLLKGLMYVRNLIIVSVYILAAMFIFRFTQTRDSACLWNVWLGSDASSADAIVSRMLSNVSLHEELRQLMPDDVFLQFDGTDVACSVSWTYIDGLYFTMATISTVGYGDMSPAQDNGWFLVFIVCYIIGGLIIAFPPLAAAVSWASKPFFELTRDTIERCFPQRAIDIDGNGEPDFKVPRHPVVYYGKGLIGPILLFFAIQIVFTTLFHYVEGINWGIAFYHCMVTATTVGYGDVSISSDGGKLVATFHMLISVSMLAATLGEYDLLSVKRTDELRRGRQFLGRLNVENILSLDCDGEGVDRFEFVVGMLTRLEYVNADDVQSFVAQFEALDQTGDGNITRAELEAYAKAQQEFANDPARAGQVSKLQKNMQKKDQPNTAEELFNASGSFMAGVATGVGVLSRSQTATLAKQNTQTLKRGNTQTLSKENTAKWICGKKSPTENGGAEGGSDDVSATRVKLPRECNADGTVGATVEMASDSQYQEAAPALFGGAGLGAVPGGLRLAAAAMRAGSSNSLSLGASKGASSGSGGERVSRRVRRTHQRKHHHGDEPSPHHSPGRRHSHRHQEQHHDVEQPGQEVELQDELPFSAQEQGPTTWA